MKIPAPLLQKIKESVNIIEIVGEHVVLRKTGANYTGLCPFHAERTPSFSVSETKQLYHCYGCRRGGDLVSFVMEIYGISFPEAIEELADRSKVLLPKDLEKDSHLNSKEDPQAREQRNQAREKQTMAYKLNRFAAAFYHQKLNDSPAVLKYFSNRGVPELLRRNFYLGSALAEWDSLSKHLESKKAPLSLASELGLVRPSQKNSSGYFDLFRNRAMFPILNMRGKVSGFGGRLLPSASEQEAPESPKYLNSTESLLFQKTKLAYGLYQAQKHIRDSDEVIIVEGYFDVLALHAAGFENAVASCGTALTADHLTQFKKLGSKIILLFDGDSAGIDATHRAMELGLEQGLVLYAAWLPKEKDPDEILFDTHSGEKIKDGEVQMREILKQAKPVLDMLITEELQKAQKSPEDRSQALKKMSAWLAKFKDPVGREIRIQQIQKTLDIKKNLIEKAMGPLPHSLPPPIRSKPLPPPPLVKLSKREKILLIGLLKNEKFAEFFSHALSKLPPNVSFSDLFQSPDVQNFVKNLFSDPLKLQTLRKTSDLLPQTSENEALGPSLRALLTEIMVSESALVTESEIKLALDRSLTLIWARFSHEIKRSIATAEANKDAELQSNLMKDYLDLQRKMKELRPFYDET